LIGNHNIFSINYVDAGKFCNIKRHMLLSLRVPNEMDVYIHASKNKALESGGGVNPTVCRFCTNTRTSATMSSGFFVAVLIGYALKKVINIAVVIVGLFFAGLAYLQYHQIAYINWNKLQTISEGAIITLSNVIIQSQSSGDGHAAATVSSLAMTSFGIPLTGSISVGFTIGFMKG
jgi:uncharacterized membrane protein (Fun14 family)